MIRRIPITEGLYCPACEQHTRREWEQPGCEGIPSVGQTDCLNPDCTGYYVTLGISAFMARFAHYQPEEAKTT